MSYVMTAIKGFISELAYESPAKAVGMAVSVLAGLSAVLVSLQGSLLPTTSWKQTGLVVIAALVPLLQAHFTTKAVKSSLSKPAGRGNKTFN